MSPADTTKSEPSAADLQHTWTLDQIRNATLRVRLMVADLESIGKALAARTLEPRDAMKMFIEAGALGFLLPSQAEDFSARVDPTPSFKKPEQVAAK